MVLKNELYFKLLDQLPIAPSPLSNHKKSIGTVVIDDILLIWLLLSSIALSIRSLEFLTNSILHSSSAITTLQSSEKFIFFQEL